MAFSTVEGFVALSSRVLLLEAKVLGGMWLHETPRYILSKNNRHRYALKLYCMTTPGLDRTSTVIDNGNTRMGKCSAIMVIGAHSSGR